MSATTNQIQQEPIQMMYHDTSAQSIEFDNSIDLEGHGATTHTAQAAPITVQWLVENFEPAEGCSLRRSTLYNYYLHHSSQQQIEPVNPASFGKLIRSVYLGLRTRRLGTRGNSKYHYYGIRVKANSPLNQLGDENDVVMRSHPMSLSPQYHHQSQQQPPTQGQYLNTSTNENNNTTTSNNNNNSNTCVITPAKRMKTANNSFGSYETIYQLDNKPTIITPVNNSNTTTAVTTLTTSTNNNNNTNNNLIYDFKNGINIINTNTHNNNTINSSNGTVSLMILSDPSKIDLNKIENSKHMNGSNEATTTITSTNYELNKSIGATVVTTATPITTVTPITTTTNTTTIINTNNNTNITPIAVATTAVTATIPVLPTVQTINPSLDPNSLPNFGNINRENIQLPANCTLDDVLKFEELYKKHCEKILDIVVSLKFNSIENIWLMFWRSPTISDRSFYEEQLSSDKFFSLCDVPQIIEFVKNCDNQFYQFCIEVLIPNVLGSLPHNLVQSIRSLAKNVENWLKNALEKAPTNIKQVKLAIIATFSITLRRYTSLNHLAQTVKNSLQNESIIIQMLNDICKVDFAYIRDQARWVCDCDEMLITKFEKEFKESLNNYSKWSLERWINWLEEDVSNSFLKQFEGKDNYAHMAKTFLLKWSFLCSSVIRDLTLRSASSFGSFHLIRLLFDEYICFIIEHKIANQCGKTPLSVMGTYDITTINNTNSTSIPIIPISTNTTTNIISTTNEVDDNLTTITNTNTNTTNTNNSTTTTTTTTNNNNNNNNVNITSTTNANNEQLMPSSLE